MKKKWNLFLAAVLLCIFAVMGKRSVWAEPNTVQVQFEGVREYGLAAEVLDIVNQERAANGKSSLVMDAALQQSAMKRAEEIAVYYSHTRPDGTSCFTAITNWFMGAGENIAIGQSSPADVMNSWMHSEGHRANILDGSFRAIGIGCFSNGNRLCWVQMFTDSGNSGQISTTRSPVTASVEILASNLNIAIERAASNDGRYSMTEGKQDRLVARNYNISFPYYTVDFAANAFEWNVSDEKVQKLQVTKDGCMVQARSAGTVEIRAVLGTYPVSGSFSVDHDWNPVYTVDREATCTEKGQKSVHCRACGQMQEGTAREIAALGHSWDAGMVQLQPTCTKTGTRVYTCERCKNSRTETLNAAGHQWNSKYKVDKAATCTAKGSQSIHCKVCDQKKSGSSKTIAAKGHKWGSWKTTKAATYTAKGKKQRTCSTCKKKQTKELAKKTLKAVATPTVKASAGKKITITWKKVTDATRYQVYCKAGKNGKYKLVSTTSKRTFTHTKRKAGTVYYYKVRASRKVSSNKYVYGAFSKVKSAKAKK